MISSTLRPAAYCSMRKLLSVAISSAFFILKGEKPNWTSTDCRNSTAVTWVWLICATTTSESSWRRKLSMSVVLPEPISPVITTKPSVNQMVDSMYALARAWCSRQVQELRVRAQPERQLAQFEVLEVHRSGRYYGKAGLGAGKPLIRAYRIASQVARSIPDRTLKARRSRAFAVFSQIVTWPSLRPGRAVLP